MLHATQLIHRNKLIEGRMNFSKLIERYLQTTQRLQLFHSTFISSTILTKWSDKINIS